MAETETKPACMMCGSEKFDRDESQPEHDGNGGEVWTLWTYCRACDCWTEHPDSPARDGEGRGEG